MFGVMSPVVQHVIECVSHLGRRAKDPRVVAVGEHAAPPLATGALRHGCVQTMRGGDLEALHASRERALVGRFHDQVDVVRLEAELADAEVGAAKRRRQRRPDRMVRVAPSEAVESLFDPQSHVRWKARGQGFALLVAFARAETLLRTAGTLRLPPRFGNGSGSWM